MYWDTSKITDAVATSFGRQAEADDLELDFGPLNTNLKGGTLTLSETRLQLVGADDPNVDY